MSFKPLRQPALPVWRYVLGLFVLLLATAQAAQAQTYRLTRLGSSYSFSTGTQSINSRGQAIFNDFPVLGGPTRAFFHDGTTTHDLGTLGSGTITVALALNDAGQVVGEAATGEIAMPSRTMVTRAFLWSVTGGWVDLGTLGGDTAAAMAINAAGQVVGHARTANGQLHAFFWSGTTGMIDLTPPGSVGSDVATINAQGQVIGWHVLADGSQRSFLWNRAGGWTDLPLFPIALNDAGQVAGRFPTPSGDHAAFWSAGTGRIDLGAGDPADSTASAIGPTGQVVGVVRDATGTLRGFSWTASGGRVDLGTLGRDVNVAMRQSINRAGQVVGDSVTADGTVHAFLWQTAGGMVDLNTRLIDAPAGLQLIQAFGIADNGAIIAGSTNGAVLLSADATAPVLGPIEASDPVAAGATLNVSAAFTDPDLADTHVALWSWGDGSAPSAGTLGESNGRGTASASHVYAAAGVYTVTLTLTDRSGRSTRASRDVTVYDAGRGHVVGAGTFVSPRGAFKAEPTLGGRAAFALVSRYVPGEVDPPGRTVFVLRGAALAFRGQPQGPVTLQGTRATWAGTGRLNGIDGHRFAVTALDASTPGTFGHGRLHLRIWHTDRQGATVVDYDNVSDATTLGTPREGSVPLTGRVLVRSRATP